MSRIEQTSSSGQEPVTAGGLSAVPKLVGSPRAAFRHLAPDPKWLGPFVLVLVLGAVAIVTRLPQELVYAEEVMVAAMERFGLGDEELDEALSRLPDPQNLTSGQLVAQSLQGLAGAVPVLFLGALLFHLIGKGAGAQPTFRQSSAIYWTAGIVGALGNVVRAGLIRGADSVAVSLSPAAVLPRSEFGSLKWLLLEPFDLFWVVTVVLLASGVEHLLGAKRGTAWGVAGTYWVVASLGRLGFQAVGAWFAGTL